MIFPRYQKLLMVLVFIFLLSLVFSFGLSQTSRADFSTDHSECQKGVCLVVPGVSGNSTCADDSDCANGTKAFLSCENNACVKINGPGIQTCGGDADCVGTTVSPHANPSPTNSGSKGLPGIDLTIQGVFNIIYHLACWLWSIAMLLLVIFIIISGIRFMYAGDDQTKITNAKTNFKYVILGTIVVMGTFVIISTVAYNIGADISFIPFDCTGSSGPTGSGNTHDYQDDSLRCYASQADCEAGGNNCLECTTNQTCIDGTDCTNGSSGSIACTVDSDCPSDQFCSGDAPRGEPQGNGVCAPDTGNAITHFECGLDNVCRQIQGPGASDCNGNGEYCDTTTTPTPTPTQYLQCINNACMYVGGLSGNLNNCVAEGDYCYNNGQ